MIKISQTKMNRRKSQNNLSLNQVLTKVVSKPTKKRIISKKRFLLFWDIKI